MSSQKRPPLYGQVVAGPPGSGKTTYCTGMQDYLRLLGRDAWVINLDPANEVPANARRSDTDEKSQDDDEGNASTENNLPYDTLLDVCDDVVNLSSVMEKLDLGPNGGLVYCMEYLENHVDAIVDMIRQRVNDNSYLIFDLPGQVELYTHGTAVPRLLQKLTKVLDLRLVAVQLIDAHYCTEATNFLSAALLGTTTMIRLELPTVNVLSKVDLLANYGPLPFRLEYFTECQDLDRLVPFVNGGEVDSYEHDVGADDDYYFDDKMRAPIAPTATGGPVVGDTDDHFADDPDYQRARRVKRQSPFFRKHEKLHKVLAEVVDDFSLLSFLPLDISSAESVGRVVARIDRCNGFVFASQAGSASASPSDIFQCAVKTESTYETVADIQERLSISRQQANELNHETKEQ